MLNKKTIQTHYGKLYELPNRQISLFFSIRRHSYRDALKDFEDNDSNAYNHSQVAVYKSRNFIIRWVLYGVNHRYIRQRIKLQAYNQHQAELSNTLDDRAFETLRNKPVPRWFGIFLKPLSYQNLTEQWTEQDWSNNTKLVAEHRNKGWLVRLWGWLINKDFITGRKRLEAYRCKAAEARERADCYQNEKTYQDILEESRNLFAQKPNSWRLFTRANTYEHLYNEMALNEVDFEAVADRYYQANGLVRLLLYLFNPGYAYWKAQAVAFKRYEQTIEGLKSSQRRESDSRADSGVGYDQTPWYHLIRISAYLLSQEDWVAMRDRGTPLTRQEFQNIKRAYKAFARTYHPDRAKNNLGGSNSASAQEVISRTQAFFVDVNESWEALDKGNIPEDSALWRSLPPKTTVDFFKEAEEELMKIASNQRRIVEQTKEIHQKDEAIKAKDEAIKANDEAIKAKDEEIKANDETIKRLAAQIKAKTVALDQKPFEEASLKGLHHPEKAEHIKTKLDSTAFSILIQEQPLESDQLTPLLKGISQDEPVTP